MPRGFTAYQNGILRLLVQVGKQPSGSASLKRLGVNVQVVTWRENPGRDQTTLLVLADKARDLGLSVTLVKAVKPEHGTNFYSVPVDITSQGEATTVCIWIPDSERTFNIS